MTAKTLHLLFLALHYAVILIKPVWPSLRAEMIRALDNAAIRLDCEAGPR